MSGVFKALMEDTLAVTASEVAALKERYSEKYNMDELGDILSCKGNNLTIAAAGAGKSTSLLLKVILDDYENFGVGPEVLKRRPRVWISTFLKAGAEDLSQKLHDLSSEYNHNPTSEIVCSTLHSVYYKIVKQLVPDLAIISESEKIDYLHKAFDIKKDEEGREKITKITGVLTLINNLVDKKSSRIIDGIIDCGYSTEDFNAKLEIYNDLKNKANTRDFDDLQSIIYKNACIKKNESFINFLQAQFDVFYLDEFQDISPIQYEILKVQCGKALKVFAIGDDDQSCYQWRGSDNNIILREFAKDFDPVITKLSTNYRCPDVILEPAARVIENNKARHTKVIKAHKTGGSFEVKAFEDASMLTKHLINDIKGYVREGKNLTVLSRTNSSAYLTLLYLEAEGELDYGYFGSPINFMSASIAKYMQAPMALDSLVESTRSLNLLFSAFDIKVSWMKIKQVVSYLRGSDYTLKTLPKESMEWLGIYTPNFYNALEDLRAGKETTIEFTLRVLKKKYGDSQGYVLLAGVVDAFDIKTTERLKLILNKLSKRFALRHKVEGADLIVTTIHGYKGLENDYVLVAPVYDGVMPNRYNKDECRISGENLSPELAASLLEEERRLFYIACTRAKEHCGVYSVGLNNLFINELEVPVDYITDLPQSKHANEAYQPVLNLTFE